MDKRGEKREVAQFVVLVLVILILSLSVVSASFIGNLLKSLGFGKSSSVTGFAGSGTSNCYDSDGKNNFGVSGYVAITGGATSNDYCSGNVAWDYYCCDPDVDPACAGGGAPPCNTKTDPSCNPPSAVFLPLTGRAIDTQVAKTTYKDCMATLNQTCLATNPGVCGCNPGDACQCKVGNSYSCGPEQGNTGECNLGTITCLSGGTWGTTCQGVIYPKLEICGNGLDEDCDGVADSPGCQNLCTPGLTQNCNVTGKLGVCAQGQQTCSANGNSWGFCTQTIFPTTEVCNDAQGLDEDCDGMANSLDTNSCSAVCNPKTQMEACSGSGIFCGTVANGTCSGSIVCGTCNSTSMCTSGVCINNCGNGVCNSPSETSSNCPVDCPTTPQCSDGIDNDGDGKIDYPQDPGCTSANDDDETNACTYSCGNKNCGNVTDSCGISRTCGTCNTGYVCSSSQVCEVDCVDADTDGYFAKSCQTGTDCNDQNREVHPGATELCDAVDQDCDSNNLVANNVSVQICGPTGVNLANTSICEQGTLSCSSTGVLGQCVGAVYPSDEVCDDGIDNDCDFSVDEGCGCTEGDEKSCTPEELCMEGLQVCTNLTWGECEAVSEISGCNVDTACASGISEVCGTNVGECLVGLRICSSSGRWEECGDSIGPTEEICDGLDNNCDGSVDEGCGSSRLLSDFGSTDLISVEGTTSDGGTSGEQAAENLGFWDKLWNVLKKIFNVARILLTPVVEPTGAATSFEEPVKCSDADGGISYFVKGSGKGLTQDDREVWFQDFCYENDMNNQLETCAGDNCYLAEKYCEGNKVKTEIKVTCEFGCATGACIPTAEDSEACQPYFDRDLWEWVSPCG